MSVALASLLACGGAKQPAGQAQQPKADSAGYTLVWADEFDYQGLPDSSRWAYDTEGNAWGWGNNELQHYTEGRSENALVKDGMLEITARKEAMGGKEYTSARLMTKGKGDWLYGRVVVRAKLPTGKGTWPAIWMLPTDWKYGKWPHSGEIDIMEHVGYERDSIYATAHTGAYNHVLNTHKSKPLYVPDSEQVFHDYILEWEPEEYRVYVDDKHVFTFQNEGKTSEEWPFDQRFHLLLNLAVGGNWGGKHGVDPQVFPQTMLVDYVRVYQKQPAL